MVAVIMLLVSSSSVLAQPANPEQEGNLWNRLPECIGAPVRDAPFSASRTVCTRHRTAESRVTVHCPVLPRPSRARASDFVGEMTPQRVIVTPTPQPGGVFLGHSRTDSRYKFAPNTRAVCWGRLLLRPFRAAPLDESLRSFPRKRLDEESLRRTVDAGSAGHGYALQNEAAPKCHRHGAGRAVGIARVEACDVQPPRRLRTASSSINSARSAA